MVFARWSLHEKRHHCLWMLQRDLSQLIGSMRPADFNAGWVERPADVLVQWENRRLLPRLVGHSPIRALVRPLGGFGHIMAFGPGFPFSFRAPPGAAGPARYSSGQPGGFGPAFRADDVPLIGAAVARNTWKALVSNRRAIATLARLEPLVLRCSYHTALSAPDRGQPPGSPPR